MDPHCREEPTDLLEELMVVCTTEKERLSTATRLLYQEVKRRRDNNYKYSTVLELNHSNRTRELVASLIKKAAPEEPSLSSIAECLVELCDNLTQLEHTLLLLERRTQSSASSGGGAVLEEEEETPFQTACYVLLSRVQSAVDTSIRSGIVLCTLRQKERLNPFNTEAYVFWTARGAFELYENTLHYHEFRKSCHDRLLFEVRGNLVVSHSWDRSSRFVCVRLQESIGEPVSDHLHIDTLLLCTHKEILPADSLQSDICGKKSASPRCMSLRRITEDRCQPLYHSVLGARQLFKEDDSLRQSSDKDGAEPIAGEAAENNFFHHTAVILYSELPTSDVVCRQFGWPKPL